MSPNFLLPEASNSLEPPDERCSWPAPSATMISAWPRFASRRSRCAKKPLSPSKSNCNSGMRAKLASREAMAVDAVMKPASLPISLTNPMPFTALSASTCAADTAITASETAVSKPKDFSMKLKSLSMVFGTPTTATLSPRRSTSSAMRNVPRCVPSPPIV